MTSASARSRARSAKAGSRSRSALAFRTCSFSPSVLAAAREVAMTLRLVLVLLLGTSSALAFDSSKLIQFGTLPLDDLTPVIAKSALLQKEISKALSEHDKERADVRCLGMRFPGPWKNLWGQRGGDGGARDTCTRRGAPERRTRPEPHVRGSCRRAAQLA